MAVLGISMGGSATLIGQPIEADAVIVESERPLEFLDATLRSPPDRPLTGDA
ncbi:MAG: hypothetical protein WB766_02300 [Roseiarcus sp.]